VFGTDQISANILPPPHDLSLPIVKLLADPSYRNYQAHSASLSLFPNLYVKFTPPMWNQTVPGPGDPTSEMDQHREWKRKIKMFSKFLRILLYIGTTLTNFRQLVRCWKRLATSVLFLELHLPWLHRHSLTLQTGMRLCASHLQSLR